MKIKKREKGFIALTSVLIIGAIVLILGIALFHSALTDYSISTAYESGQQAAFLADFCLKEGVLKLKENIAYMGGEEMEINGMICSIGFVEDINENTKKISSLGRAGDQPHFSRSSRVVSYIIESSAADWAEREDWENLEIIGDSLVLEQVKAEEIIRITDETEDWEEYFGDLVGVETRDNSLVLSIGIILNEASEKSCADLCGEEGYQCVEVWTDPVSGMGKMFTISDYQCEREDANCYTVMMDQSYMDYQEVFCEGHRPNWTYCRCE